LVEEVADKADRPLVPAQEVRICDPAGAGLDGEKLRLPAGFLDGLPGLGQLDLLDSVSREKSDLLPL
jgi:hypothetical protein